MDAYQIRRITDKALVFGICAAAGIIILAAAISLIWFCFTVIMPAEMNKIHPIAYWGLWPLPAWFLFITVFMIYNQWGELSPSLAKFLLFLFQAATLYAIIRVLLFVF